MLVGAETTVIEAHGGKIWAHENPDRGVTFQFTLPVISEEKKSLF